MEVKEAQARIRVQESVGRDLHTIQEIYAYHVKHGLGSFEETAPSRAELARRRDEILARRLPYVVAESDGAINGFAYAAPYRARSAYRYSVENSVYVAPDAQRRGVARALLSELIERCTALGFRQMVAVIGDSANNASILLHRELGFRRVGTLRSVGFKGERWVDSLIMQRALGTGAKDRPE